MAMDGERSLIGSAPVFVVDQGPIGPAVAEPVTPRTKPVEANVIAKAARLKIISDSLWRSHAVSDSENRLGRTPGATRFTGTLISSVVGKRGTGHAFAFGGCS